MANRVRPGGWGSGWSSRLKTWNVWRRSSIGATGERPGGARARVVQARRSGPGRPETGTTNGAAGGPSPLHALAGDVLDVLVLAMLSQATSDANAARAFTGLRETFPTWYDVVVAGMEEIGRAIAPGGLGPTRAPRLQRMLLRLLREHGDFDLSFLRGQPVEEAMAYLTTFEGVGTKTAACVLLFGFGADVLPVDTHIHRITQRLGLVSPSLSAAAVQRQLAPYIPAGRAYSLHLNLLEHGRQCCRPGRPRCRACILQGECDFARAAEGIRQAVAETAAMAERASPGYGHRGARQRGD